MTSLARFSRLAFLAALASLFLGACQGPESRRETLDIMTFNIRYGKAKDGDNHWEKRRELVFGVFRDHQPQVVGLQEALDFQIEEIQNAHPQYGRVGIGRDGGDEGEFSAILYLTDRYEVLDSGTFWLSDTPEVVSTSWGNKLNRICTWARFRDKQTGSPFYVFNTHFDHQSVNSREQSALLVGRRIASREHPSDPYALTGDFNAGEDSQAILNQKGGPATGLPSMVDTFRVLHPHATETGTFNSWQGERDGKKIDYIFAAPSTEVLEAAIIHDNDQGRYPSDHYPVKAKLRF